MAARLFNLMLCALLLGLSGPAAKAITHSENRVGGSPVFSSDFASQESAKPIGTPSENTGYGYDFASGTHKYLYVQDNPVNNVDPSGHLTLVGTLAAISIADIIEVTALTYVSAVSIEQPFRQWTVYSGTGPSFFHAYVAAKSRYGAYRYDIGLPGERKLEAMRHPFTTYTAYLRVRKMPAAEMLTGPYIPIGKLSSTTFSIWNSSITGIPYPEEVTEARPYEFLGRNCLTYSLWWTGKATALSALPF